MNFAYRACLLIRWREALFLTLYVDAARVTELLMPSFAMMSAGLHIMEASRVSAGVHLLRQQLMAKIIVAGILTCLPLLRTRS